MRGMHPFDTMDSAREVVEKFWDPLKRSIGSWQRRADMFLAGENWIDEQAGLSPGVWVVEMGHLVGLFDQDWLGIRATNKLMFLRYAEFHRVENGKIAETASYIDLVSVLHQAGFDPFGSQTGAQIISPGPRNHGGLLYDAQNPGEGRKTLDLINAMVADLVGGSVESPTDHLERFWTPDMNWFGPAGIGASGGTLEGYRRGHAKPFEDGLEFIRHNGHQCRVAEGHFGGFFGYPSLTMRSTGGFLGLTASSQEADMRIVDLYRRDGDKLAENWIFIDILHFLNMQGVDVLARLSHP